jgi:hypothetical protein
VFTSNQICRGRILSGPEKTGRCWWSALESFDDAPSTVSVTNSRYTRDAGSARNAAPGTDMTWNWHMYDIIREVIRDSSEQSPSNVLSTYIFQTYTRDRNWEFIDVIFLFVHNMFRPLRAILRWNTIYYLYISRKLSILQRIRCIHNLSLIR